MIKIKNWLDKHRKITVVVLMLSVNLSFLVGTTVAISGAPDLGFCLPNGAYVLHATTVTDSVHSNADIGNLIDTVGGVVGGVIDNSDSGNFNFESIHFDPTVGSFTEDLKIAFKVTSIPDNTVLSNLRLVFNTAPGNFFQESLPRTNWISVPVTGVKATDSFLNGANAISVTIPKDSLNQLIPSSSLGTFYFKLQYHPPTGTDLGITDGDSNGQNNCGLLVTSQLASPDKIYNSKSCEALGITEGYQKDHNVNQNYFTCSFANGEWTPGTNTCNDSSTIWSHCGGYAPDAGGSGKESSEFSQYGTTFCAPCLSTSAAAPIAAGGVCTPPTSTASGSNLIAKLNQCQTSSQQHIQDSQSGETSIGQGALQDGDRNMTCVPSSVAGDNAYRCLYTGGNKSTIGQTCTQGQNECSTGICVGSIDTGGVNYQVGKPGLCVSSLNASGLYSSECDAYQRTLDTLKTRDIDSYNSLKAAYVTSGTGANCTLAPAPRCGGKDSLSGTAAKLSATTPTTPSKIQVLLSGCISDPKYGYLQAQYSVTPGAPNGEPTTHPFQNQQVLALSNSGKLSGTTLITEEGWTSPGYIRVCATPLTESVKSDSIPNTLCTDIKLNPTPTGNGGDTIGDNGGDTGTGGDLQGREACTVIEDQGTVAQCDECLLGGGTWTGIGCIATTPEGIFASIIRIVLGVMGGVVLLRMIYLGYLYQSKDEKKIAEAKAGVISTLAGILVVLFSILILRIIGVNILNVVPAGFFG